jgi:hypothetical protein
MRWKLTADWPASAAVIEAGTIIDGHDPAWVGVSMPLNVLCLDQEAADAMCDFYPHLVEGGMHLHAIRYANGVNPKKGN